MYVFAILRTVYLGIRVGIAHLLSRFALLQYGTVLVP